MRFFLASIVSICAAFFTQSVFAIGDITQNHYVPMWGHMYAPNIGWINLYCQEGKLHPSVIGSKYIVRNTSASCSGAVDYNFHYNKTGNRDGSLEHNFSGYAYEQHFGYLQPGRAYFSNAVREEPSSISFNTTSTQQPILGNTTSISGYHFGGLTWSDSSCGAPRCPEVTYDPNTLTFTGRVHSSTHGWLYLEDGLLSANDMPAEPEKIRVYMDVEAPVFLESNAHIDDSSSTGYTESHTMYAGTTHTFDFSFFDVIGESEHSGIQGVEAFAVLEAGTENEVVHDIPLEALPGLFVSDGFFTGTVSLPEIGSFTLRYTACDLLGNCATRDIPDYFIVLPTASACDSADGCSTSSSGTGGASGSGTSSGSTTNTSGGSNIFGSSDADVVLSKEDDPFLNCKNHGYSLDGFASPTVADAGTGTNPQQKHATFYLCTLAGEVIKNIDLQDGTSVIDYKMKLSFIDTRVTNQLISDFSTVPEQIMQAVSADTAVNEVHGAMVVPVSSAVPTHLNVVQGANTEEKEVSLLSISDLLGAGNALRLRLNKVEYSISVDNAFAELMPELKNVETDGWQELDFSEFLDGSTDMVFVPQMQMHTETQNGAVILGEISELNLRLANASPNHSAGQSESRLLTAFDTEDDNAHNYDCEPYSGAELPDDAPALYDAANRWKCHAAGILWNPNAPAQSPHFSDFGLSIRAQRASYEQSADTSACPEDPATGAVDELCVENEQIQAGELFVAKDKNFADYFEDITALTAPSIPASSKPLISVGGSAQFTRIPHLMPRENVVGDVLQPQQRTPGEMPTYVLTAISHNGLTYYSNLSDLSSQNPATVDVIGVATSRTRSETVRTDIAQLALDSQFSVSMRQELTTYLSGASMHSACTQEGMTATGSLLNEACRVGSKPVYYLQGHDVYVTDNGLYALKPGERLPASVPVGGSLDVSGLPSSATLVVEDGTVHIKSNIISKTAANAFGIVVLPSALEDRGSAEILVYPEVTDVHALLYAEGPLLSVNALGGTTFSNRRVELGNQLYFFGALSTYNTTGGSAVVNEDGTVGICPDRLQSCDDPRTYDLTHLRMYFPGNGSMASSYTESPAAVVAQFDSRVMENPPPLFAVNAGAESTGTQR